MPRTRENSKQSLKEKRHEGVCGRRLTSRGVIARTLARRAGLSDITMQGATIRFGPVELRESQQLRVNRLYPGTILKAATRTILVPVPKTARVGGKVLRDREILDWASTLIRHVLLDDMSTVVGA